jgi:serine/threonine protein kinase
MPRVIVKDNDRVNDPIYSDPSVLSNYQIMTHIGKGAYATVSLAIEKSTMKTYAIKIYEKAAVR